MKRIKVNLPLAVLCLLYVLIWCGGIGSHLFGAGARRHPVWAPLVFLILAGGITLATTSGKNLVGLFAVALLGLVAEIIAVRYSFLFSAYHYTMALQPQVLGVPLMMTSVWLILFAYVKQMLLPFRFPLLVESLIASFWMTSLDALIEPLATGVLHYWTWQQSGSYFGIPAHNFLGRFLVSLALFNIVRTRWHVNHWAHYVGFSVVLFFTLLALAYQLYLVFFIGLALCGIDLMVAYSKRTGDGSSH